MKRYLPCFFLIGIPLLVHSQADNNSIQNRMMLHLGDGWQQATTRNGDVQWDCINKALTRKCLIYHNDQWFTLQIPGDGAYYLNISNQQCSKKLGVQIVVIEGDPCKTSSYKIKKCIPTTQYSDFYLKLDSLESGQEYLINIDGFLEDQCDFLISVDTVGHGYPIHVSPLKNIPAHITQQDSLVTLQWEVPDSLAAVSQAFHILRVHNRQNRILFDPVPIGRNAYGATRKQYSFSDTLRETGNYAYFIYSVSFHEKTLLRNIPCFFREHGGLQLTKYVAYQLQKDGYAFVYVYDESGNALFAKDQLSYAGWNNIRLDFAPFYSKDIRTFKVVIRSKNHKEEKVISFE